MSIPSELMDAGAQSLVAPSGISNFAAHVLLADSDSARLSQIGRLLASHFRVTAVADDGEVLGLASADPPHVILFRADVSPRKKQRLLKALRADLRTAPIPVIMISDQADALSAEKGNHQVVDDCLVQPFSTDELIARVAEHVAMSRLRRALIGPTPREQFQHADGEFDPMQAALRASEQRYRQLVQGLPAAVCACDAEGRVTLFNQAAAALWGREPDLGKDLWCGSWRIYHSTGAPLPPDQCPMAVALREGRSVRGEEIVIERPDGSRRYVLPHPEPIRDASGAVVGAVNMLVDITDQKQAQVELATTQEDLLLQVKALTRLHDLAMRLASTPEAQPALQAILETLVEAHGADFGLLSLYDSMAGVLRESASVGFDAASLRSLAQIVPGPEVGACGCAFSFGQRAFVENIENDSRFEAFRGFARSVGFQAVHSTPIVTRSGDVLGVISVHFKACRVPTQREMQLADLCARHAADSIEAANSRQALCESEERFTRFMQHLPGLAWIKDAEGKYVFANDAATKAFQVPAADLLGKADGEVFPLETASQFQNNDRRALASEAGIQTVETLEQEDGTHFSLVNKFPIPGSDGRTALVGGMAIDITDRKQAEEALRESEDRFRTLASHAPVGIFQSAPNGDNVFVNESWCAMSGLTPKQARGEGWTSAVHPDDRERVVAGWKAAVRDGVASESEFRFLRADGVLTWLQGNAVPLRTADGQLTGYIGTIVDVTERKTGEITLRESEERFRHMADHVPVMIWVTEVDGRCSFLGKSWYEFTGQSPETGLGFGWIEAVHPDDRGAARDAFVSANTRHIPFVLEYRLRNKTGKYHWAIDAAVPRFAADGQFVGFIGSVIDIAERKKAEEALMEADRRKDEFLAVLAHELRNPLAPIRTGLELMRLAGDDRALIEDVRGTMERQTQQMVRLIDDLLDVSRITRGTVELRKCRVELATVVENAVETARPVIEEWGHKLTVSIPTEPIILDADPTRLAQIISNLLNNAAKYTSRGGEIALSANRQGCEIVVAVKDSGIGIPAEMLDRIFDMFTQVDSSLERSHGGLGIGLTLVKRLVAMHGGAIEARSDGPGKGSEFVLRLPIVVGRLCESRPTAKDGVPAAGTLRVLVVDDNEHGARVLGMLLKALGNDVRTAHDGLAAVELAAEFLPDLVLLDIGMPKLNGYDAARRIREQPGNKNTMLVALTGWGQDEDKQRARAAGFDHHFVKPVEPAALQKLLAECQRVTPRR